MSDNSVCSHAGAMAIDFNGGRLVVEARISTNGERLEIAFPSCHFDSYQLIAFLVARELGICLCAVAARGWSFPNRRMNGETSSSAPDTSLINETGNGRFYYCAYLRDKSN